MLLDSKDKKNIFKPYYNDTLNKCVFLINITYSMPTSFHKYLNII